MSTTTPDGIKTRPSKYSYHREPLSQGSERYAKCTDCGREVIAGCEANLTHAPTCRHREVRS